MVNATSSCLPKCEGYCYKELATHEDSDDAGKLTTRLFWTGVPATNSYRSGEPVKMKLWLQISGKLGHRCTVISNLHKLGKGNVPTSKNGRNLDFCDEKVGTDLVPEC